MRRTLLLACIAIALCGCDDRETVFARCRIEAMKTLKSSTVTKNMTAEGVYSEMAYTKECMVAAGYRYNDERCKGEGQLTSRCYDARTMTARISNFFQF